MEIVESRGIIKHSVSLKAQTNTIIIGAGAAGLACAATLKKKGISFIILEKSHQLAAPWRAHYDRLHLNTEKWRSNLPFLPFPDTATTYLSRDEVVNYMECYATTFGINPFFNQQVESVSRFNQRWKVSASGNEWLADNIIIATGNSRRPVIPSWPGIKDYNGNVMHSAVYKNGAAFKGKKVLVIGFGSSACEIAICLHEYGGLPSMSVKGGVNVVPRDTGNRFISKLLHKLAFFSHTFPALVDYFLAGPLQKRYGFLKKYGLSKLPYGPNVQLIKYKKVPVLDIGTMELIKMGKIIVYPGIKSFTKNGVCFTNGQEQDFDSVILATGYKPDVYDFLDDAAKVTDQKGRPLISGNESALTGLFFCGFSVSPYGMLNQISREAHHIAGKIASKCAR